MSGARVHLRALCYQDAAAGGLNRLTNLYSATKTIVTMAASEVSLPMQRLTHCAKAVCMECTLRSATEGQGANAEAGPSLLCVYNAKRVDPLGPC